jgi:hypothetical protein
MTTLSSPGVSVTVEDQSLYQDVSPTTTPLVVFATRKNKAKPDGTGTALGTSESNKLRLVTSQRDVLQLYGDPVFVTSGGEQVHGHETNEYGLHALWSFMGRYSRAYCIRADIDLGGLIATTSEPLSPPADGTYWIDKDSSVGGIYRRNAANTAWEAVTVHFVTTAPDSGLGADGDWAFDYSDTNGTLKVRADDDSWNALGTANLTTTDIDGRNSTNNKLWQSATAPTGAGANDYWLKTSSANGGFDLKLKKYRASDDTWVDVTPIRSSSTPTTTTDGTVWEDTTNFNTNGTRPLKVATSGSFGALTAVVQDDAPTTDPSDGDLWFDDTLDFKMYIEASNAWEEVETTTDADPTNREKYISASAPSSPATGAIWVDVSGVNLDTFPVIKRYTGSSWEDITDSVVISSTYTAASTVDDGTYWINLADPATKNTVKVWDSTYEPPVVNGDGDDLETFSASTHRRWKPMVGATFGRRAQREAVVTALQAVMVNNQDARSDAYYYQLIAAPGYPELYDEIVTLNTDIKEVAFGIADVPSRMIPSGVPVGKEVTITQWKANAKAAAATGEDGFTSSGYPYAAHWYPWALSTNVDGTNVMVPSSTVALRTLAYNDSVAKAWFAPMGDRRGIVTNAASVGYLTDAGEYSVLNLTPGQRDVVYDNNVNPIAFFYNKGLRVWGQKTSYGTTSALDRINVARLIAKMRYDLNSSLTGFIGEPADPITWASARNIVERYLAGLKSLRAIYDGAVRCDGNNNTSARIDRNELWVDVAIRPIKAVEFIYVPIKIYNTADEFDF